MSIPKQLQFRVPLSQFQLGQGDWVWDVADWPFVKDVKLHCLPGSDLGYGWFDVTTTRTQATERVRQFCESWGFEEVS